MPLADQSSVPRPNSSTDFPKLLKTPQAGSSSKPSWIGPLPPSRPFSPGIPDMKTSVKLSFSSPGLKAPVYIVTSLSQPQWHPVEMEYIQQADGELKFSKDFEAEEGQYQYKFRLGPGDWWALDESKPSGMFAALSVRYCQANTAVQLMMVLETATTLSMSSLIRSQSSSPRLSFPKRRPEEQHQKSQRLPLHFDLRRLLLSHLRSPRTWIRQGQTIKARDLFP